MQQDILKTYYHIQRINKISILCKITTSVWIHSWSQNLINDNNNLYANNICVIYKSVQEPVTLILHSLLSSPLPPFLKKNYEWPLLYNTILSFLLTPIVRLPLLFSLHPSVWDQYANLHQTLLYLYPGVRVSSLNFCLFSMSPF